MGGAVAALLVGAIAIGLLLGNGDETTTPTLAPDEVNSPADVATALGPAVVQIDLFGGLEAGGGVGSGVIYDTGGLVLTAHHVVAFNDEVEVRTADDRTFTGRVVGRAPERDLAIVALVEADQLVAAPIAEPGSVEVGDKAQGDSMWEAMRDLQERAARDFERTLPILREEWAEHEEAIELERSVVEAEVQPLLGEGEREGPAQRLSEFMQSTTDRVLDVSRALARAI
jgi:hypothetical protein